MPDQTPDTRASLSQAYIELVGYCPFADDPSATVDSVRAMLDEAQDAARQPRTELTPSGEQYVMPGCERNLSPTATQLDLF